MRDIIKPTIIYQAQPHSHMSISILEVTARSEQWSIYDQHMFITGVLN